MFIEISTSSPPGVGGLCCAPRGIYCVLLSTNM